MPLEHWHMSINISTELNPSFSRLMCVGNQFPINFDCWFVSVEARIGLLLIIDCIFNCQPWLKFWRNPMSILHQHQCKSKLSQVNSFANISTKHHDPFKQRQFPVYCQIHHLVGFWGSTHSLQFIVELDTAAKGIPPEHIGVKLLTA